MREKGSFICASMPRNSVLGVSNSNGPFLSPATIMRPRSFLMVRPQARMSLVGGWMVVTTM